MSATIPESMRLDDLLKATGYDCPAELQGKTFDQATEGGGADLEDNKTVSITENGVVEITPSAGKDGMKKVTATVNVSGGGGDVPTDWYLWQDNYGYYCYLPFSTAPDTLDSPKIIDIGNSLVNNTSISTLGVTNYTKNSDTEFTIIDDAPKPSEYTFTRITEDVPIGGGAELEDNKTVSITENGVVEITPTAGKDGMKKVTATVNVSGGGTAYAWVNADDAGDVQYTNFDIAPETLTNEKSITLDGHFITVVNFNPSYEKISDTSFLIVDRLNITYTRDATKDFTLWELSE